MKKLLEALKIADPKTFKLINTISKSIHGFEILENPNARIIGHIIQGEIQIAIAAIGYMFSVSHIWPKESLPAYEWMARIFVDPDNIIEIRDDSPAKAILTCYLATTEAQP